MLSCLLVDDDPMDQMVLQDLIATVQHLDLKGTFGEATAAYNFLLQHPVDLLFLDILMPGMNGLELLSAMEHPPYVILISGKREYALEAYEFAPVDYLLKPVAPGRFLKAISRAVERISHRPVQEVEDHLFIKTNGLFLSLPVKNLLYVEAKGNFSLFHTTEGKHAVYQTMKATENHLTAFGFLRVHRSFLVNPKQVKSVEDNSLDLGTIRLPLSRSYRKHFFESLQLLGPLPPLADLPS